METLTALCQWLRNLPRDILVGRHGVLLPMMEFAFAMAFVLGALYANDLPKSAPRPVAVELKSTPWDETLRSEIAATKMQIEALRSQISGLEDATRSAIAQLKKKETKGSKSKPVQ